VSQGNEDPTAARFAANVRARRELRGWSQRQLAEAMSGLGYRSFRQQTVAEIEAGFRSVKLDEALAMSRALGITVDNLIRPAGLTSVASELLAAAWEALDTTRQVKHWTGERAAARRRLAKAITAAKGHETELDAELAVAQRALAETED
jgi:transcriptional regulator with XRE-family HTH domain